MGLHDLTFSQILMERGIVELLLTSDDKNGFIQGSISGGASLCVCWGGWARAAKCLVLWVSSCILWVSLSCACGPDPRGAGWRR